jgi:hypothetical protein
MIWQRKIHALTLKEKSIYKSVPGSYNRGAFITMLTHQKTTEFCSYKWWLYLLMLLFLIIYLNLYDILHTMQLIREGLAVEGNPLMRYLLEKSPAGAVMLKMTVVAFFVTVVGIYARKNFQRALAASALVATLYSLLAVWHLTGLCLTTWYIATFR